MALLRHQNGSTLAILPTRPAVPRQKNETLTIRTTAEIKDLLRQAADREHRSPNNRIQLVNFWPNMELDEYINLEQRVSGRMVLLDISATGEENLIEQQSGNPMNDLEYRRKQLLKLQDTVTRHGADMASVQQLLAAAVASIVGKSEERAIASLFSPGGTHALKGEFAGSNDFEVIAYMVILPEQVN
jgi:hypothetical protein